MTLYSFAKQVVSSYFRVFFKWRVYGKENIPETGPVILVANHISNYDPPVLACSINREVNYMAKDELFRIPILKNILRKLHAFPIKRGANDLKAIKTGLNILRKNQVLGIFPEGTRSKNGEIGKGLPGAALFALKTDAVVIPVGIVSTYKWFKPLKVKIGSPLSLEHLKATKITPELLDETIAYIMLHIKKQVDELKEL